MTPLFRYFGSIMALKTSCKLICLMTFGLVLASGAPALAATSLSLPPAAQEAVNKGMRADKKQDYLAAIGHFREALRIAPNAPELLFYLGVEESRIPGRELRAIAWLGAYLSLRANGPVAAKAKNHINKLKIAHQKALLGLITPVEDAARFAERKGPSLRDVARKLAEIGDFTSALRIAGNLSDLPESEAEAYGWIAESQARSSDFAGALRTTNFIDESQPAKGDALLHIVSFQVARDRAAAQETVELIQNQKTKDRAKRIVSYFQARTGEVASALKTAESIQDEDIRGSARNDIAHVQVGAGDLAGALNTAILIPALGDGNFVLQHISLSQARKGDIEGALKTAALYGPHSDLRSRVAMVQAERGDLAGALETAALMEKDKEDYYTRSMLQASFARAQMRGGDGNGARKTLASARQSAGLVSDSGRKEAVLRHIALVQAEGGDVAGAMAVAGQIQSAYWKGETQKDIAEIQAKGGDIAGALKTASVIQYRDIDMKSDAQHLIAQVQAKGGNFSGALNTADLIQSGSRKAAAQRIVAELQVESDDLAGAQETAGLIQDVTQQNEAQRVVDTARFKAGDLATLWRQRLEDSNLDHDGALNAAPFLDLPKHLQSVSASEDSKKLFAALYRTFIDLIDAEIVVHRLLERQTKK